MDFILKEYLQFRNGLANEEGQTMAEYGLLLALIAVVVIVAITALGTQLQALFNSVTSGLAAT